MRAGLLLIAICLAGALSAQSYSVTSGALTSGYTDLASPTNSSLVPLTTDGPFSPAGFSFDYFGATYTSFSIAASGYIIMGGGTQISKPPAPHLAPGNVISPGWLYLDPRSRLVGGLSHQIPPPGTIGWEFSGGVLQVEWNLIPMYNNSTSNSVGVRMKLILDTASGSIEFRYGSVPGGTTGATISNANAVCISGPTATTPQEIIPGSMAGYINNDGSISTYPAGRFVRFTPATTPTNTPPLLVVSQGSSLLPNNSTINVNYNDTVAGLNLGITASDADSDPVSIAAGITNIGGTGIVQSQWESGSQAVPYTLTPTNGIFNTAAGITHVITLTAKDATSSTVYTLNITQAPQASTNTPPGLAVVQGSTGLANNATINVNFGDTVASLNLGITASDADSDPVSITASITNIGGTGIVQSQWESGSAGVPYTLTPGTGTFNTVAGVTHVITLTANDGTATTAFTLNIVQAAQPAMPSISVSDGSSIAPGQAAAGTARAFGDLVVGTGPSAALTITISNNGAAMLTLSNFAVAGDSGEFIVNTGWMTPGIGSGGSTTFTIEFSPTSTGPKSATISFNHDDTSVANPFTFEITGNGTTSTPGPGPTPVTGGGGGGGGGCVAGSGANLALLLMIAMSACLGARTLRQRVSR